jgi:hypothetical protein
MKRWAYLTTALYVLILGLLTVPALVLASLVWSSQAHRWHTDIPLREALTVYREWGFWLWIGVLVACQLCLLVIPAKAAERRPVARRHVGVALGVISFLLANIFFAGVVALACGVFGDEAGRPLELFAAASSKNVFLVKLMSFLHLPMPGAFQLGIYGVAAAFLTNWSLWLLLFYRFSVSHDPASLLTRGTRWLLRGSILELLVAVPSHIAVRGRNDCCAPGGTFWGLATGISIMLISFGPGVFFLFAQRVARLRPKKSTEDVPAKTNAVS